MKEFWKVLGKDVLGKAKEKLEGVKPKFRLPKNFVDVDVKLGEKLQVVFQIKKPERENKKC